MVVVAGSAVQRSEPPPQVGAGCSWSPPRRGRTAPPIFRALTLICEHGCDLLHPQADHARGWLPKAVPPYLSLGRPCLARVPGQSGWIGAAARLAVATEVRPTPQLSRLGTTSIGLGGSCCSSSAPSSSCSSSASSGSSLMDSSRTDARQNGFESGSRLCEVARVRALQLLCAPEASRTALGVAAVYQELCLGLGAHGSVAPVVDVAPARCGRVRRLCWGSRRRCPLGHRRRWPKVHACAWRIQHMCRRRAHRTPCTWSWCSCLWASGGPMTCRSWSLGSVAILGSHARRIFGIMEV